MATTTWPFKKRARMTRARNSNSNACARKKGEGVTMPRFMTYLVIRETLLYNCKCSILRNLRSAKDFKDIWGIPKNGKPRFTQQQTSWKSHKKVWHHILVLNYCKNALAKFFLHLLLVISSKSSMKYILLLHTSHISSFPTPTRVKKLLYLIICIITLRLVRTIWTHFAWLNDYFFKAFFMIICFWEKQQDALNLDKDIIFSFSRTMPQK